MYVDAQLQGNLLRLLSFPFVIISKARHYTDPKIEGETFELAICSGDPAAIDHVSAPVAQQSTSATADQGQVVATLRGRRRPNAAGEDQFEYVQFPGSFFEAPEGWIRTERKSRGLNDRGATIFTPPTK